jgi:hypothetical protein
MRNKLSSNFGLAVLLITICIGACTPDNKNSALGALPKASFTVSPLTGATNTFVASASTTGVFGWYWGTGSGAPAVGTANDTIHFSQHGNYRLTLTVVGHGGYDTTSQIVSVANDDLGNTVIQGGYLNTASASDWTVLNTGGSQTTFTFTDAGLVASNTGSSANTNGGIYQAIQVQAGHTYTFSATVQGSGIVQSWVEFYIGATVPAQGSDYSDNKLYSLNWWSGCGINAYEGDVVKIGCSGSGATTGKVTFSNSGTYYVIIKAGSSAGTLGSGGVTISDILLDQ